MRYINTGRVQEQSGVWDTSRYRVKQNAGSTVHDDTIKQVVEIQVE